MTLKDQSQTNKSQPRRARRQKTLDVSSALLLVVGIISGIIAFKLTETDNVNALIMVPAVVAATAGALNIVTTKSPR